MPRGMERGRDVDARLLRVQLTLSLFSLKQFTYVNRNVRSGISIRPGALNTR
jgi:hypothetical protein